MPTIIVHLFAAHFGSREAAIAFCERDWGDAPDDDAAEEIWEAWEAEFPKWPLKDELGIYLDEDFIELHFGSEAQTRLKETPELDSPTVQSIIAKYDTLVVVGHEALGGFEVELKSIGRFEYLGVFNQI